MNSDPDCYPEFSDSSDSEASTSTDIETENDKDDDACDFFVEVSFFNRRYRSKDEIVCAIIEYHSLCRRNFETELRDDRRLLAVCSLGPASCSFQIKFIFGDESYGPPPFLRHTPAKRHRQS